MKISDLLKQENIILDGPSQGMRAALETLVRQMSKAGNLNDPEEYMRCVLERENQGTTAVGEGIAIPHAKTPAVSKAGLCAMVCPQGAGFSGPDGQPVRLFFLIAAPDREDNIHLDVLGRLSALLMDQTLTASLIKAKTPEEFLTLIDRAEAVRTAPPAQEMGEYTILAVTACPTGIAHTYMAAESLESTAREMGVSIKVETAGSGGTKNALTPQEIRDAKCIIVAADRDVGMERFRGKPVIQTGVADGIHKAHQLLEAALSGSVPPYEPKKSGEGSSFSAGDESAGKQIYRHLMSGVSALLPFVIGGGLLIATAFLADSLLAPEGPAGTFGSNASLAAFLKNIGDTAFGFMLPVLAGFIAQSIGDRPALAPGFVGGALASAGGSGFLGALIAGFAAGYLLVLLRRAFDKLPASLEGTKPILIYPLLGALIMGLVMIYLVNPPVSLLNLWIAQFLESLQGASGVLLGALLAGMMSVDMGGPVNKAAYVFGTASLLTAAGDPVSSGVMAAVMAGGMVPPLAVALCMTFFPSRFTEKERSSRTANYIMGLSFITEGVIPFAAADPLRVIPSCVAGSAVAGALSMLFGCRLPAPHGGIFVLFVMDNWPLFLAALAAGALVGMAALSLLKKPVSLQE